MILAPVVVIEVAARLRIAFGLTKKSQVSHKEKNTSQVEVCTQLNKIINIISKLIVKMRLVLGRTRLR